MREKHHLPADFLKTETRVEGNNELLARVLDNDQHLAKLLNFLTLPQICLVIIISKH